MCRTGGRRCDAKWDDAHRERYNARRRIVRNGQKAERARKGGDEKQTAYYEGLVQSATEVERELDSSIRAHEAESATTGDGERERCGECGQFVGSNHSCPGAAFRDSAIRDEDGNLAVLHHGSSTDFQNWDPEFTGTGNDSWGSGFYFTHSESLAHGYGEHVKSVVLNIQNPIRVNGLDDASLDHVFFDAEQSEAILRRHPDIYRQPNDEEEMNPLGDYSAEFWDKDEWSKEEIDSMISKVSKEHFDDVQWSHLENVFQGGQTDQFRRGVRDATGHDGVVVDFKEDGHHTIAWFPEQVHEVSSTSNGGNTPNGGEGGNAGDGADSSDSPTASAASAQASASHDNSDSGGERCPQCGRWAGTSHDCPQRRTHDNLREISAGWRDGWTKQEEDAFDTYGGIEHYDINAKLRSGAPLTVREAQVVRDLDSALERAPRTTEEQTLYRAFGLASNRGDAPVDEWVDEHFPQGEVTSFDAYTSATPDNSVAEYFSEANSEYTEGGVLMEIKTRQGGYTGDSAESEVLLRRGSRFEVVSNDEAVEMNGKRFRKVVLQEKASRFGAGPAPEHPLSSHASSPMEVSYIRNPTSLSKSAAADHDFGQDVEPSGRYLTESGGATPDGWESGTVRFEKPLHLEFGESGLYSEDDNWKRRLSGFYDGKTGEDLSKAVQADGYDGIVTHDKYGTSEIVDLTSIR